MRGWNFTVATVLDALFDLLHRAQIFYWLDLWDGPKLSRVPAGISLGFFEMKAPKKPFRLCSWPSCNSS
jgi:hypothetical protein